MRVITYNVNGIRSAISKGFYTWLQAANPDVLLLQEIKATQAELLIFEELGYHIYSHTAQKKGYSGVALLSKQKPLHVEIGTGMEAYDNEGRVLRADFEQGSVMSLYLPSGSSGDERQAFKYLMLADFYTYIENLLLEHPKLIIGGDFNICHKPIDIHNPKSNAKSSGFLPEERAWMEQFISNHFIDSFRAFNQDPHHYTWWSYRFNSRDKNLGWRIDYLLASKAFEGKLTRAAILPEARHSDHCPSLVEVDW